MFSPIQAGASPVDLNEIPEYQPYIVESLFQYSIPTLRNGYMGSSVALVNVDQDPELEIIRSKCDYLICEDYSSGMRLHHWQNNLQAEFFGPDEKEASFSITGTMDLGRDKPMVVAGGSTPDFMKNRFWVIDPETGKTESQFDLPSGPDLNGDKKWDGAYTVIGAMDIPTETGLRKALIIICKVGFDLEKRGVYAVDPWTGEILWDFLPGSPLSHRQCQIQDINGDGTPEILLTSSGTDNLQGRKINGFSDDRPYLFVLKADGTLQWYQELAPEPGFPYLVSGDLDGDGNLEIVVVVHCTYSDGGSVLIWNSQGELQASFTQNTHFLNCLLIPTSQENKLDIITGNRFSSIIRLGFEKNRLVVRKEATNSRGIAILGLVDLPDSKNGHAAKGIITQDRDGQGRILDKDFKIIGAYQDNPPRLYRETVTGFQDGKPSFILVGSKLGSNTLVPNPSTLAKTFLRQFKNPRLLLLSGLGLGLILAWLIWRMTRHHNNHSAPSVAVETHGHLHLKERRLHLLEDLEISNHGAMAPLRSLRRLLWMLDAVQSGVGVNPNLVARMKEIWQDCHEDALPRLINILERARLAQISDSVVDESLASLSRINKGLAQLNSENFTADSVNRHLADLHKEEKTTEALLQSMRRQVGDFFRTPLSSVLEKVLRANHAVLEKTGVKVQTGMAAMMNETEVDLQQPAEALACRMDADELGFILDNLVGNACRAMASAPRRDLHITWQPVNGVIKIDVIDTGIGIATEDHQRVLETGFSARPGGGLGLPKSQRLLKKYGGHLSIKRSKPGQGTTFSLVVPST